MIPGGQGTRPLINNQGFINDLKKLATQAEYCLTVCTGSALLAQTGLLDNKNATSNKNALAWVRSVGAKVCWMNKARWVTDQKYYTSSGISAGIDMALGFVADKFGDKRAREIAQSLEYIWNSDSQNDPFAK
jgi:transcriptional regulator GlxA family with amidase domain